MLVIGWMSVRKNHSVSVCIIYQTMWCVTLSCACCHWRNVKPDIGCIAVTRTRVQAKESMTWRFYSILHFPHSFSCRVRGICKNLHPSQVTLLSKTEKQYCEIPAWEIYIDIFWAKHTKLLACKYNLAQLGTKVGRLQLKSRETVHFPRCTTVLLWM